MGVILGTIISFILNIFYSLFKLILKIIKDILVSTRLIIPVLYALVFLFLHLTGILKWDGITFWFIFTGFIGVTLYSVYLMIKKLLFKKEKANAKKKGVNAAFKEEAPIVEKVQGAETSAIKPKVYRVKQNERYIMHEYPDRVELFEETVTGLKYIRTDYTN